LLGQRSRTAILNKDAIEGQIDIGNLGTVLGGNGEPDIYIFRQVRSSNSGIRVEFETRTGRRRCYGHSDITNRNGVRSGSVISKIAEIEGCTVGSYGAAKIGCRSAAVQGVDVS